MNNPQSNQGALSGLGISLLPVGALLIYATPSGLTDMETYGILGGFLAGLAMLAALRLSPPRYASVMLPLLPPLVFTGPVLISLVVGIPIGMGMTWVFGVLFALTANSVLTARHW